MTRRTGVGRAVRFGVVGLLALASCTATVGTAGPSIPRNSAAICAGHCGAIGMRLSAVAIMASNVGCVCQAASAPAGGDGTAGALTTPAAGMATIVMQQAAADQARRQRQQSSTASSVRR